MTDKKIPASDAAGMENLLQDTLQIMRMLGNDSVITATKLEDFIPYSPYAAKAIDIFRQATAEATTVAAEASADSPTYVDVGHDEDHIVRVCRWAMYLGYTYRARIDLLVPAAILHDLVNAPKNNPELRKTASRRSADKACKLLFDGIAITDTNVGDWAIIYDAILCHSYSAGIAPSHLESEIIQDADRLDSLGLIGTARCLGISGAMGRPLWDIADPEGVHRPWDDSKYAMDHFQIKLFKLPATMRTGAGKALAQHLCERMRDFYDGVMAEVTSISAPTAAGVGTAELEHIQAMAVCGDFINRLTKAGGSSSVLRPISRRYRSLIRQAAYVCTLDETARKKLLSQRHDLVNLLLDVYSTQVSKAQLPHFEGCELLRLCGWKNK